MTGVAFVDGEQVEWPGPATIDDPTTVPGAGLFETMRATRGDIPLTSCHLGRLLTSAEALGLRCPTRATLEGFLQRAVAEIGPSDHRVRLVLVTSGHVVIQVAEFEIDDTPIGLSTVIGPVQAEGFAEHKTTAYLPYVQARQRAEAAGADHALIVGPDGSVLEADHASVVALIDDEWVTPSAEGILPGIARALLIERLGVRPTTISVADLARAGAVFVVNALRGASRVAALDGRDLPLPGEVLGHIRNALPELHRRALDKDRPRRNP